MSFEEFKSKVPRKMALVAAKVLFGIDPKGFQDEEWDLLYAALYARKINVQVSVPES